MVNSHKSTIYDLAALARTSASTVSASLNGTWQQRRISEETAKRVQQLAQDKGYALNRQASGLRRNRSGLIGMMIPTHEDRFFGVLSQAFERMARERGLHPMVVSTLRDPAIEVRTVQTLISYQVEHLIVTGATHPDGVSALCMRHRVRHVNVDLPGKKAPSITSDNRWGAAELTRLLIARSAEPAERARNRLYFLGGIRGEFATEQRVLGFSEVARRRLGPVQEQQLIRCGYDVNQAEVAMARLYQDLGGLPRGLLLASGVCLEGALRFLRTLPMDEILACTFGSYDWDPFAAGLRFPVHMVRQNVEGLMSEAYKVIDGEGIQAGHVVQVRPVLIVSP
ncbi:LacI family DNA-binding transcriptional regulator [Verminephrobacter aporrectodeae subsp. tuberculatae]|uniref:LacI family DNA-binding transcriptional regulator n=1 Tax=Verminephrobacter aporrectodeae TaxID=1110389 RepID=UPI002237C80A|nr:LacI family DNA-binding transcriptional regulator [Verminephrobacter aporrectodeae]MCW5255203.1 LacI family DNA-binding transcriptional regulator [Verminephrobacter aporrectodeae subsp. tuberculatae]MCW8197559.1 LacI family DNA-binding transcriptional regulator [Verminephrobacter aporrectodeae subsp. tuberculatae]